MRPRLARTPATFSGARCELQANNATLTMVPSTSPAIICFMTSPVLSGRLLAGGAVVTHAVQLHARVHQLVARQQVQIGRAAGSGVEHRERGVVYVEGLGGTGSVDKQEDKGR